MSSQVELHVPPSVYQDKGVLEIVYEARGFPEDEFIENLLSHDLFKNCEEVETSFYFQFNGNGYFFTATRIRQLGVEYFTPVFTAVHVDRDSQDGKIGLTSNLVEESLNPILFNSQEFRSGLKEAYPQIGVKQGMSDYLNEIEKNLGGKFSEVSGTHLYETQSGLYTYRQITKVSNPLMQRAMTLFGSKQALKVGFKTSCRAVNQCG